MGLADGQAWERDYPFDAEQRRIDREVAASSAKEAKLVQEQEAEDAAKWRALMASGRIRIMGRTNDYNHIGVEFWADYKGGNHPCADFPQDACRAALEQYVAQIRGANADRTSERGTK
ncbi:hypothetical protein ACM25O_13295 [Sulfitobacter pontiacus]